MSKAYPEFLKRPIKRLLHVGGNTGQEGEMYKGIDFTFVEPVPEYAEQTRQKGYNVIEVAIGERGTRTLNVSGGCSSFLDLPQDSKYSVERKIEVDVIPLSDIEEGYDALALDTEGTVLEVLKTSNLPFKNMIVEARDKPYFIGEPSRKEITKYLESRGFRLFKQFSRDVIYVHK